jgi:hypothetical protein
MPGKPNENPDLTRLEEVAIKKEEYLQFFSRFPVQGAAADFIGRSPDTIQLWQKDDPDFAAAVSRAKAEWASKNIKSTKPDNLLAHLYSELRPPKQELDVNLPTTITINHVHPDDQHPSDAQTG